MSCATYARFVRERDLDVQVVRRRRDEDLQDQEVLLQAQGLLLVAGQLHLAVGAEGEDAAFGLLAVGLADGGALLLPLVEGVLALEGEHLDGGAAVESQSEHVCLRRCGCKGR